MLPLSDYTPEDFALPATSVTERLKAPVRRYLYPVYNLLVHRWLTRKYRDCALRPDRWLWGNRGNDYARNRLRVDRFLPLAGKDILVVGCGSGRDVVSWLPYHPVRLVAVDYLNYDGAWRCMREFVQAQYPATTLDFRQADITNLSQFPNASFDVVGSDAVFEHVTDIGSALQEIYRLLRPGGILYASYGPLWQCWGGDHISGFDGIAAGYNHLLLEPEAYRQYLDEPRRKANCNSLYADHGLFSYLRAADYLAALADAGFDRLFCGIIIEPKAVRCLKAHPKLKERLCKLYAEMDLIMDGMTVIYRKPA